MSGVYFDFQACYDGDYWRLFEQLEEQQIRLIEDNPLGYMRIYFPEQLTRTAVLDALEAIIFRQSMGWSWEHYGRIYRKLLPEDYYGELAVNVQKRQRKEEEGLRQSLRQELELAIRDRNQLNASGYLQFRARKWQRRIQNLIHEEYCHIEEKIEQQEFISLLRLFVSTQAPVLDTVYLMIDQTGSFQIKDEQGHNLRQEYLTTVFPEELEDISEADLMMSILVTLLPKRIMLHLDEYTPREMLHLLEEVFHEQIVYW